MLVIFDSRGWPEIRFCPEAAPGRLDVFTTSLFERPKLLHKFSV